VAVQVIPIDNNGITGITADSVPLSQGPPSWDGTIYAVPTCGYHNVIVLATNGTGGFGYFDRSLYRVMPVVGITGRSTTNPIISTATPNFWFRVWGVVSGVVPGTAFVLNDGSVSVYVIAASHTLMNGDFAEARGVLNNTFIPATLQSAAGLVRKY
jgi:hypothetical protein